MASRTPPGSTQTYAHLVWPAKKNCGSVIFTHACFYPKTYKAGKTPRTTRYLTSQTPRTTRGHQHSTQIPFPTLADQRGRDPEVNSSLDALPADKPRTSQKRRVEPADWRGPSADKNIWWISAHHGPCVTLKRVISNNSAALRNQPCSRAKSESGSKRLAKARMSDTWSVVSLKSSKLGSDLKPCKKFWAATNRVSTWAILVCSCIEKIKFVMSTNHAQNYQNKSKILNKTQKSLLSYNYANCCITIVDPLKITML